MIVSFQFANIVLMGPSDSLDNMENFLLAYEL